VASQASDTSLLIKCMNMINFDQYFQLIGRMLVASQDGDLANYMVILVALQEFSMRITYIPKQRLVRRLLGLGEMHDEERARFLEVMAIDNASSMQSEMVAIVTATACKLMLWDHRILFDMDFDPQRRPDISTEMMTLALALVLEGLSDMTAMVIQGKQGLVPTTIFQGERKWEMAGWMMGSQLFAVGAVLWTFMARPVWYRCSCSNMCSCESYVLKNQLWSMFCGVGEYECDALGADVC